MVVLSERLYYKTTVLCMLTSDCRVESEMGGRGVSMRRSGE